jgi:preprotein translocase subunit SecE
LFERERIRSGFFTQVEKKRHMKKQTKKKKKKGTRKKTQTASQSNRVLKSDNESISSEKVIKPKPYQGPQKKELERKSRDKPSYVKYFHMAGQFLRECRVELRKVKWPTRKELLASTAVVIVLVLLVSLFLGLIDVGLIRIIRVIVG